MSDQLVTRPLPKHRTTQTQNKHIHIPNIHAFCGNRTHDPGIWSSEDSTCLRQLSYRDRLSQSYFIIFYLILLKLFKALCYILFSYCVLCVFLFIFVSPRFGIFTAMIMKNVFLDVGPCISCLNRRFGRMYLLHLQGRKIRERGTSVSRWLQTESPIEC
jgi:hypothetical protein